jgi:hypothetical protein
MPSWVGGGAIWSAGGITTSLVGGNATPAGGTAPAPSSNGPAQPDSPQAPPPQGTPGAPQQPPLHGRPQIPPQHGEPQASSQQGPPQPPQGKQHESHSAQPHERKRLNRPGLEQQAQPQDRGMQAATTRVAKGERNMKAFLYAGGPMGCAHEKRRVGPAGRYRRGCLFQGDHAPGSATGQPAPAKEKAHGRVSVGLGKLLPFLSRLPLAALRILLRAAGKKEDRTSKNKGPVLFFSGRS